MAQTYNDPAGGTPSSIGAQLADFYYYKKALIEIRKDQYFSPLADTRSMPKHMGKTIKQHHYIPLLDARNDNDQGLDAAGSVTTNGNLYGSSKDIGAITAKLPTLSESGGRVNRVGFTRLTLTGSIEKFGFFDEYTQESLDFDSDSERKMHITTESLVGANELTEAALQADLLNGAGVIRYPDAATSNATISGEVGAVTLVSYSDLMRLDIDLDNNRCPKHTKIIDGSRMTDTKVINSARVLYIGSELQPTMMGMVDLHGNPAFISVEHYAAAGTIMNGEIGTVGKFRVVVNPEMQFWESVGAAEVSNDGYRATASTYDVFPMLVVGSGSFTTIGFQTDGKSVKFKIIDKPPGENTADRTDPYGETGFYSIKWYYGILVLRPEWIALVKTVAPV
jgi:N4-gp56 family major capsid protein